MILFWTSIQPTLKASHVKRTSFSVDTLRLEALSLNLHQRSLGIETCCSYQDFNKPNRALSFLVEQLFQQARILHLCNSYKAHLIPNGRARKHPLLRRCIEQ